MRKGSHQTAAQDQIHFVVKLGAIKQQTRIRTTSSVIGP
jgi:hypothetical protein